MVQSGQRATRGCAGALRRIGVVEIAFDSGDQPAQIFGIDQDAGFSASDPKLSKAPTRVATTGTSQAIASSGVRPNPPPIAAACANVKIERLEPGVRCLKPVSSGKDAQPVTEARGSDPRLEVRGEPFLDWS